MAPAPKLGHDLLRGGGKKEREGGGGEGKGGFLLMLKITIQTPLLLYKRRYSIFGHIYNKKTTRKRSCPNFDALANL